MMKNLLVLAALALVGFVSPALAEEGSAGNGLEKLDTDGDGKISKQEFMSRPEKRFGKMDADGDGFISQDEMNSAKERKEKRKSKNAN
jgi:Ca2+-binding EF-hand superfamily protein